MLIVTDKDVRRNSVHRKSQVVNRKGGPPAVSVEAIRGDSAQRWRVARNGAARRRRKEIPLKMGGGA